MDSKGCSTVLFLSPNKARLHAQPSRRDDQLPRPDAEALPRGGLRAGRQLQPLLVGGAHGCVPSGANGPASRSSSAWQAPAHATTGATSESESEHGSQPMPPRGAPPTVARHVTCERAASVRSTTCVRRGAQRNTREAAAPGPSRRPAFEPRFRTRKSSATQSPPPSRPSPWTCPWRARSRSRESRWPRLRAHASGKKEREERRTGTLPR